MFNLKANKRGPMGIKSALYLLTSLLVQANLIMPCNFHTPGALYNPHEAYSLNKDLENGYWNQDGSTKDPSIKILEQVPEGERYGECHNYALSKALGLKGKIPEELPLFGCSDWWDDEINFLRDYCEKTDKPKPGDIARYTKWSWDTLSTRTTHTALVYDYENDLVESKWWIWNDVLIHPTHTLPESWLGDVEYYTIVIPQDEIIKDIKRKLSEQNHFTQKVQKERTTLHNWLIDLSNGKENERIRFKGQRSADPSVQIATALKQCMLIDINTTNEDAQSPLMLAAKHNKSDIVKTLLTYKANPNLQDKDGNTALILASKNNSTATIALLHAHALCNRKLRDNSGNKASYYEYQHNPPAPRILRRMAKPTKSAEAAFWNTINS